MARITHMKSSALLLTLMGASHLVANEVVAEREGKQVVIRAGNREILRYQAEPGEFPRPGIPEIYRRGAYIQSIFTPSGRLITDDFPENHLHHHGVWSSWTTTEFEGRHPDFWNMARGSGTVEFVSLDGLWQRDGKAGFSAHHRFVDLRVSPPKTALLETWSIAACQSGENFIIDFSTTQNCASGSSMKLPEYRYGGFGFRGNAKWNGIKECRFLSASGLTDREKLNGSREKWCWVGGTVDGRACGMTILSHPANFRFPEPIRAHQDEPFFCFAPQQLGEMSITPEKKYVARYRLVIADGEPDAKAAEVWWTSYANSPLESP